MNEWLMILCMIWAGGLFSAGGTDIPGIGGQKWLRRYLLPAGLAVLAFFIGLSWWKCLLYFFVSMTLSAGYGERTPMWQKTLVFASYAMPSLLIGFSWWVVITPATLAILFAASNWKPMASTVFWKSWEFLAGVFIALCYIGAFLNRW